MNRLRPLLVGMGLVLSSAAQIAQGQPTPRAGAVVNIVDVGQGDSILIRSPEGKTALIDAGPSHVIVDRLRQLGVTSIDLVVVSHHHSDHYGGMEAVIREFRPKVFLSTDSSHTTPTYLRLLERVRDDGIKAIFPTDTPRKIDLGTIHLTILPQPPENRADENDNSIGVRVQHGAFSMLLTGDSELGERIFWESNVPELVRNCDVLKLAHHGSRNGTDARWLNMVRPKLAVASLGSGNEYGHPHPQTLSLLAREQIPLLRTDLDGTITIESDGERWEVVGASRKSRGPPARTKPTPEVAKGGEDHLIDVNTASQGELELLPAIGPTLARRIIEGRPYLSVDDLLRVKGIGEKRLAEIRPLVTVK